MSENWAPYKFLWCRIGGKPWTHIIRDAQRALPLPFLLAFLSTGIWVGIKLKEHWIYIVLGLVVGILVGHLFW